MNELEFIERVRSLVSQRPSELDSQGKANVLRRFADQLEQRCEGDHFPRCEIVPFMPGRRPLDEASAPGLGSSDQAGLILDARDGSWNAVYVLYRLANVTSTDANVELEVTLSFVSADGQRAAVIPGWDRRPQPFMCFSHESASGLVESPPQGADATFVFRFLPEAELLPSEDGWSFADLPEWLRNGAADARDPFDFGHQYLQTVRVELSLARGGEVVASARHDVVVCDGRRIGELYQRVVDRVIAPNTRAQAEEANADGVSPSHHPWFPVLCIGAEKADLYMRALVGDIVEKQHQLTDPLWLLRVGVYLELLTCLGIFEAARGELGDLLSERERQAFDKSATYRELRERVNPSAWSRVWDMRDIAFPSAGTLRAGAVSAHNLLRKKRATLAFLHTHHDDLKHAIALAGRNTHNAQETWHRVFRDAERAVLGKTEEAFPELAAFPRPVREVILWYRHTRLLEVGLATLPGSVGDLFSEQEGLYASACNQYRASMNDVADWAKARGWMDHTGDECIPIEVSLLAAHMHRDSKRLARLQRADGYSSTLHALPSPDSEKTQALTARELVNQVSLFSSLTDAERDELAGRARRIELAPLERILIEGSPGSSLFVVASGDLEALKRTLAGDDIAIATLGTGAVIGERSLLTGDPRSATVRSIDGAVVYEIARDALRPILELRPTLANDLAALLARRQSATETRTTDASARSQPSLVERIRRLVLGIE